jgi:hypothetical protein
MEFAWYATYVTLWAIVLLGGLVVVGLVRTVYRLEHRVEMSLQRAGKAPDFTGLDLAGNRVDSAELAGSQYGLLFVKPSCIACEQSLTTLSPIRRRAGENLLIVCEGDRDECMNLTSGADGAIRTVIDRGGEIGRRFGVGSVPMVIVVGAPLGQMEVKAMSALDVSSMYGRTSDTGMATRVRRVAVVLPSAAVLAGLVVLRAHPLLALVSVAFGLGSTQVVGY